MDRDYSFLDSLDRGMYFDKKEYDGAPLLSYEEVKDAVLQSSSSLRSGNLFSG